MSASFVQIEIDGRTLNDFSEGAILQQAVIRQELNQHWWCDIEFRQSEDKRFPFEDALGKTLRVSAVDEEGAEHQVFLGFVLESELEYEVFGSFTARLTGVTNSYKLDMARRRAYYDQMTPQDIVQKLAGDAGLTVGGAPIQSGATSIGQYGDSDFRFILFLADGAEGWVRPTDKGIEIQNSFQPGATLQWRNEDSLVRFQVKGKLSQPSFTGADYHYGTMESSVQKAVKDDPQFYDSIGKLVQAVTTESGKNLPPGYICQRYGNAPGGLTAQLKQESRRAMGSGVTGCGVSRDATLAAGNQVQIDGPLDAQGTYGITKVVHHWVKLDYWNEFWCTPWKRYTAPKAIALEPWHGVMPARVVDNNDPENLGRIKVQFFWEEDNQTRWVRMMTPHAGGDRGFYALPEIGDEVWITCEDGDPKQEVALGCAWNGVDKPPREDFWGGDVGPNDVKRLVTKSGHRVSIVDKDGKETICLATPKHVKVMLTENSNESGRATLTLQCDDDIVISAGGRIHLKSAFYSREVG